MFPKTVSRFHSYRICENLCSAPASDLRMIIVLSKAELQCLYKGIYISYLKMKKVKHCFHLHNSYERKLQQ